MESMTHIVDLYRHGMRMLAAAQHTCRPHDGRRDKPSAGTASIPASRRAFRTRRSCHFTL
eukprot:1668265-Prymnesium_polylepis.2